MTDPNFGHWCPNFDEYGDAYEPWVSFKPRKRKLPSCKRCGKEKLTWHKTEKGWRLFESHTTEPYTLILHECGGERISALEDFKE